MLIYLFLLLCGFLPASAQKGAQPESMLVDGMKHYMKEDFGEAILVFEKLAKVQTQEPAVFYYLAKSYLADKQLTSARTNAEKAHLLSHTNRKPLKRTLQRGNNLVEAV